MGVLLILVCLLIVLLLAGGFYAYRITFYAPPSNHTKVPDANEPQFAQHREVLDRLFKQIMDRPCEYVTIVSHDGLTLSARYYHVRDGAPIDLCFHGYRSTCFTDFAGGSQLSFKMGHNLLLVDQRAHGRSEGSNISFGIKERLDVQSWAEYAAERFGPDAKLLIYGVSMGGATVLMASGLELPANVKGIIADCPFSSPMEVILHVAKNNPVPQWLVKPFVIVGAKVYGGIDIMEMDAVRAVKNARVPILIIHGEADTFVPCHMSEPAQQANPALVHRHTFPGAEHALSYMVDSQRYEAIVKQFVEMVLN